MDKYKVVTPIRLFAGRIGITDKQAKSRMHNLSKVSDGLYDIDGPVCFKAGEVLSFDCDKVTAQSVVQINESGEVVKAAPKKKARKKAKK